MDKFVRYGRKRSRGRWEQGQQEKEREERETLSSLLGGKERVEGGNESGRADSDELN